MEQLQKKTLLILFASLLSSCSNFPAVPVCKELSMERAYCINTVTDQEFYIDEENTFEDKTWWEQRHTMILLPPSSWADIKKYLKNECRRYGKCPEARAIIKKIDKIKGP